MADDVYLAKMFHLLLVMLGTLSGQEAMLVPPTERSVEGPPCFTECFSLFVSVVFVKLYPFGWQEDFFLLFIHL